MTSNIGARKLKEFGSGVGFATKARVDSADDDARGVIQASLKKTFSPEFLNRIDDVMVFNSLGREHIFEIIDIAMKDVYKRLADINYHLELSEETKAFLAEKGYDPQFGARPLHRAIQKYLEDPLAEFILNDSDKAGKLIATFDEEKKEVIIKKEKVTSISE